jgi:hypothetical protein
MISSYVRSIPFSFRAIAASVSDIDFTFSDQSQNYNDL